MSRRMKIAIYPLPVFLPTKSHRPDPLPPPVTTTSVKLSYVLVILSATIKLASSADEMGCCVCDGYEAERLPVSIF